MYRAVIARSLPTKFGWVKSAQEVGNGAPGEIRTPDLTVRSRSLYPAELRAQSASKSTRRGKESVQLAEKSACRI